MVNRICNLISEINPNPVLEVFHSNGDFSISHFSLFLLFYFFVDQNVNRHIKELNLDFENSCYQNTQYESRSPVRKSRFRFAVDSLLFHSLQKPLDYRFIARSFCLFVYLEMQFANIQQIK